MAPHLHTGPAMVTTGVRNTTITPPGTAALGFALAGMGMGLGGCTGIVATDNSSALFGPTGDECRLLNFDNTDDDGVPDIFGGDVLTDAYASLGVHITVWRDSQLTDEGLPVAFDGENVTGGDYDLKFPEQGRFLISQEKFTDNDRIAGRVSKPDDDRRGAIFEITFDEPVCLEDLKLLDIDKTEARTEIYVLDEAGSPIFYERVTPAGNNEQQSVDLARTCGAFTLLVCIPSSGAVDDILVCPGDEGVPTDPDDGGTPNG